MHDFELEQLKGKKKKEYDELEKEKEEIDKRIKEKQIEIIKNFIKER